MKKEIIMAAVFGAFALTGCQTEYASVSTKEASTVEKTKKVAKKSNHKRVTTVKLSNNVLKSPCANTKTGTEDRIDCCYDVAEMCQPGGDGGSISDQLQTKCQSNKKADVKAFWQTKNKYCKGLPF